MKKILLIGIICLFATSAYGQLMFTGVNWKEKTIEVYSCGYIEDLSNYRVYDKYTRIADFGSGPMYPGEFKTVEYYSPYYGEARYSIPLKLIVINTPPATIYLDRFALNGVSPGWAYRIYGPEPELGTFNQDSWIWGDWDFPAESFEGCDPATPVSKTALDYVKSLFNR